MKLSDQIAIPKYVATCVDDEDILFKGVGDTPEDAYKDFIEGGEFEDQCAYLEYQNGLSIDVYIYTVIDVRDSEYEEEEIEEGWVWCLDKKIDTISTAAI